MPVFFWVEVGEDRKSAHEENRLAAVRATEENRVYFSRGKVPELYWRLSANLYLQSDSTGSAGGEWAFEPGEGLKDLSARSCVSIYRSGR